MKTKLILCMLLIVALLMTGCNTSVIPPDLPHDSDSSDTGGETGSETTGGDTMVPTISATMNNSSNKRMIGGSHLGMLRSSIYQIFDVL